MEGSTLLTTTPLCGWNYITFNQLHCAVRLLGHTTYLATMLPGQEEPGLEQLNNCIAAVVAEI